MTSSRAPWLRKTIKLGNLNSPRLFVIIERRSGNTGKGTLNFSFQVATSSGVSPTPRPMKPLPFISLRVLLVISCLLAAPKFARAQGANDIRARLTVPDSAHLQVLTLKDGSTIFGRIVAVNADTVVFQTSGAGTIQLQVGSIREIKEIALTDVHEGSYWFPNPNSTRLFFAPTGQMLKKGEGYVSDYELFFPGVAYGLTDNITIGGGVSLLPQQPRTRRIT